MADIELERFKMYQDSFKHMMTFSSGGIVLAAAVTGGLFPNPVGASMLGFSIFLLALGALLAMGGLALTLRYFKSTTTGNTESTPAALALFLWFSVGATYLGLALFSIFAVGNL